MGQLLTDFLILLTLLALGHLFGTRAEQKHFAELKKREAKLNRLPVFSEKILPAFRHPPDTMLVSGSVVVTVDYFKRFAAGIVSLFGGRIMYYESLLERGRREAMLRMREAAAKYGGQAVFNVKLETASVSRGARRTIGSVEVLAYGTAIIPQKTTKTNWNTGRFKQPLDTLSD